MAGASMNDIKSRIKSVTGTMQITKAMELVATSKLRRARENVDKSRPFHEIISAALNGIMSSDSFGEVVWTEQSECKKPLYIVIAGDRGLAGGFNTNIFRLTTSHSAGREAKYLPIGKKSLEHYRRRDADIVCDRHGYVSELSVGACLDIADEVCHGFAEGRFDSVFVVYTKFVSMISQVPVCEQLLPLKKTETVSGSGVEPIYVGGSAEDIVSKIMPEYIGGVLNCAICESLAAESAARRTAMNAANKNASEIIDTLVLKYNRARQAVITQEITEIVSGSEAL
ncbi:MAG: ATP synthase F1 subunit gamma [Clostridia bacterium]|nr:ATP synthase F1 subunit gamma [Clostridia bacterium]